MTFKLILMPFELQPHFLDKIKSWKLAQSFIMAKHEEMQKVRIRGAKMELGEKQRPEKKKKKEKGRNKK